MFASGILAHLAKAGVLNNIKERSKFVTPKLNSPIAPPQVDTRYNKKEARQLAPLIGFNEQTDMKRYNW